MKIEPLEVTKHLCGELNKESDSISFQLSIEGILSIHFAEVVSNLRKCLTAIDGIFATDSKGNYFEIDTAVEPEDISGRNILTWTIPTELHAILQKYAIRLTTTIYP